MDNRGKRSIAIAIDRPGRRRASCGGSSTVPTCSCATCSRTARSATGSTPTTLQATQPPRSSTPRCRATGSSGPTRPRPGFDVTTFFGRASITDSMTEPGGVAPIPRPAQGDHTTGIAMVAADPRRPARGRAARARVRSSTSACSPPRRGRWRSDLAPTLVDGAAGQQARPPPPDHAARQPLPLRATTAGSSSTCPRSAGGRRSARRWSGPSGSTDERFRTVKDRFDNMPALIDLIDEVFAHADAGRVGPDLRRRRPDLGPGDVDRRAGRRSAGRGDRAVPDDRAPRGRLPHGRRADAHLAAPTSARGSGAGRSVSDTATCSASSATAPTRSRRSPPAASSARARSDAGGLSAQNSVGWALASAGTGSGVELRRRPRRPGRGSRRASSTASTLSGVWTNTVGVRPSREPARRRPGSTAATRRSWRAGSSRPMIAHDRPVRHGLAVHRQAGLALPTSRARLGSSAGRRTASSNRARSTRRRRRRGRGPASRGPTEPSKNAGWRTSTATRWRSASSVGRRRTNVASAPRSGGPNDAGSCTEICSARSPERGEQVEELAYLVVGVAQPALVGDRPRQLEEEPEAVGGLIGPRRDRRRRRQPVERRVALDGVAPPGVGRQLLVLATALRQRVTVPGLVRPHRAPDPELHRADARRRLRTRSGARFPAQPSPAGSTLSPHADHRP